MAAQKRVSKRATRRVLRQRRWRELPDWRKARTPQREGS